MKARTLARDLLTTAGSHRWWVSKQVLASFLGFAITLLPVLMQGCFKALPLYDALASKDGWAPSIMVRLSNAAYRVLHDYWSKLSAQDCTWDGLPADEYLFTDASSLGYGAHLSSLTPGALVSGVWQPEDVLHHITFKELCAVKLAF